MFKSGGESCAVDPPFVFTDTIDQASFVLDRERSGGKGAIRTFGLSTFDFAFERLDQFWLVRSPSQFGQIEVGCGRLTMNARYECCDRISICGGEVAKIDGFEQGEIAFWAFSRARKRPIRMPSRLDPGSIPARRSMTSVSVPIVRLLPI
jgi:hypothetical protein